MKIKWTCKICGDIVVSDSSVTHQMDMCECRMSGLDLEEYYSRTYGAYERLEIIE